ncbi:MAG TPA: translocation/assembly module TamB domain-containing protein, partial [Thermoanaerobaculia bacterium]|nr:translocation/assembly module TamB domain-containing protein [Thermoanaerobaculia bacterium]
RPRGRLEADLEVAGTVGEPRLEGSARLTEASAFVVPLGITIEDVELAAEPNAAGELVLAGSLRSGDGILTIRGRAPLEPRGTMVRVELSGQNVVVMDLPDRRVLASTDELTVAWLAERIEVFGDVRIPQATIQLGTDDPDAVTPSRDVVFVRLPPGSERALQDEIDLYARVRLLFGEEVRVSGFGLETGVRGSLLVIEEPGRFTRATGELDLAGGTFAAYGARLELERGRLVFAESAVTRPAIDLRAFRRARSVLVGVEARGTLEQPRVTLWSEPPMPQAEQLSYLVLGRPLGEASQQEGDLLTRAAGSLGLRGGRYLAERLGSLFGLEEARIETGEGGFEEASLVLGKFLSPRLYMAYGVGLFEEGASSILVRYLLSEKLTLEALTGKSTRADVLYVIETGPGEPRPALKPELPEIGRDR